ncbi:RlpA-like double-psi beta-barrel-protein domain-containing protein-containing protein [Podospora appendiculata]|uniref:Cellulase n=1 Tax=Podospora appendiculata TaxID=314037 RepID=A0AAE1C8F2_9PEZI|nr:RlpA-like double-psi beta-barrel-protein domain-containing protein-containing protein [Podospora appendiculata]
MRSTSILRVSFAVVLPLTAQAASGTGKSTRYWDCCKPSCSWSGKASVTQPVFACDANNNPLSNVDTKSGCDGGSAYTCASQTPWAINDQLAYGFAATAISGGTEASWCCGCYALTFTSGPVAGKTMVVQSTSTGGDLGTNHFDLAMPGGGVGIFDGCTKEFGGLAGAQYGGISSASQCASFPSALQPGCNWRFDWFKNADNPSFTFTQVQCPAEIVAKTGCRRSDDGNFPVYTPPASGGAATTSAKASSTSAKATSTTTSQNSGSTGCTAAQWAQCGGTGFTGCTNCVSGTTCKAQNAYYSQCS